MDPFMKQKCDKKLQELQQCMPFLLNVLEKLRNNNRNDPARQIQLEKIQKLYNLLNDKTQIFKWDLLVKCENVIHKLQRKMELQGETEILVKSGNALVEEKDRAVKETVNKLKREDLSCPESPPPQQLEHLKNIQPVVIPTERRCSPPISSKHKEQQNGERQDRKSGHTHRHHKHHHHHHGHRHKQHESSSHESSRDHSIDKGSSYNAKIPLSFDEQEKQNTIIDQYLLKQRKQEDENRQTIWQRRHHNTEVHNSDIIWPHKSKTPTFQDPAEKITITIKQPTAKQTNKNVFSRLGEKLLDSDDDIANGETALQFSSTHKQTTMTATKTPPIISDFLKSPPLSANDITLLLNESNTNSNSSEPVGISAIGTRRSTPATLTIPKPTTPNVDNNNSLDMVRKKFALLTKTETSAASPPPTNEFASLTKALSSINQAKTLRATLQNSPNQTTPTSPTDRVPMKYQSHSHPTVAHSYNPTDKHTSPVIVPKNNVNVLPTLRPNDPRLRKTNITSNGNISTLPSNNLPLNAVKPVHHMSPISNTSATPSSTPSPIYGNIQISNPHPSPIPFTTTMPIKTNIIDPRLQRNRQQQSSSSCTISTQKRPLLVSGDSSDENWDLDDNNARGVIFPQPRPFPNRNPTYNNVNSGLHHLGNTQHAPTIIDRRPSVVWDNAFPTPNHTIVSPNINTNNFNLQGGLPSVDDPKYYQNTNWHAGSASATTPIRYNANLHKHVVQNNASNDNQHYLTPRTYGAYKEARARAAAEQAARKAVQKEKTRKETTETENKTEISAEVDTNACATSTSLDTTYRNVNLTNCELSKTIDFKIPKKLVVPSTSDRTNEKAELVDNQEKTKPEISPSPEHKVDKATPQKETSEENTDSNSTSIPDTSTKKKEHIFEPKPQRSRFRKKNTDREIPAISKENIKSPPSKAHVAKSDTKTATDTFENDENKVIDDVGGSDSEATVKPSSKSQSQATSSKLKFLSTHPARILKRRCTMIDKASASEVDKEKLNKVNAMLFEDLQERERKNKSESENKLQTTSNRRHGEICYDKTDDGCTVSTQNIITGKRRTRTKANFNEVQQGIAVFKHLKPSEQKKDAATSAASPAVAVKERKKPGPKSKIKLQEKVQQEKVKTDDKPAEESGSKIRKRPKTLIDTENKTKIKKEENNVEKMKNEEEEKKCEKSSDTLPNVTSIFDTFIQKILNPATNADELINKLRDILSEHEVESLLSVREAMLKKHLAEQGDDKDNKDIILDDENIKSAADSKNAKSEETVSDHDHKAEKPSVVNSVDVHAEDTTQTETSSHMRAKAPRRSELDRLHEDIRDMFISEGVLTATGKRMCTFVEPSSTKPSETEQNKVSTEASSAPPILPLLLQPRMRKPRVLLPTLKIDRSATTRRSLRKVQLKIPNTEDEKPEDKAENEIDEDVNTNAASCSDSSFTSDMTQISSTTVTTVSTISSTSTDLTTTSSSTYTKSDNEPLRPMPILKALKPIRSCKEDEVDDLLTKHKNANVAKGEKPKSKRYKPCPKSKKPAGALLEDDGNDDADIEDSATDVDILCGRPKIKTELLDIAVPYEDISTNVKEGKTPPKNINPKWHWASRYAQKCVVCEHKAVYMSVHYKKYHTENYVSRLAPIILQQFKQQSTTINKPIMKLSNKKSSMLLFRCPFCLQFKHTSCVGWLEHFITHTGEYYYECTLCHSSFNKAVNVERHMKEKCAAHGGRYLHNDELDRACKSQEIKAYVCHLCNFLRLGRRNLERHYMEQHGYDVKNINNSVGYVITLLNVEDSPIAKSIEELIKMETKLCQQYQSDIISLDDDDNDVEMAKATAQQDKPFNQMTEPMTTVVELGNSEKNDQTTPKSVNEKESSVVEKEVTKQQFANENSTTTAVNRKSNANSCNTKNTAEEATTVRVSAPVSSAFMSTTDDSNDGETPSVLARKLFTVDDETELCNKSPSKSGLGGVVSMAERLCQRLKEVEANTASSSAQQRLKEVEVFTPIQQQPSNAEKNSPTQEQQKLTNRITPTTSMQQHQNNAEENTSITPMQQHPESAVETPAITTQLQKEGKDKTLQTPIQQHQLEGKENKPFESRQQQAKDMEKVTPSKPIQNQQKHAEETPVATSAQSATKQSENKDTNLLVTISKDTSVIESGGDISEAEIDLTNEEDDDGWEDIEILETAPSTIIASSSSTANQSNKESKMQKNKINRLQKFSRFYATMAPGPKSQKKVRSFPPLIKMFSGVSNLDKDTTETVNEKPTELKKGNNERLPTTYSPTTTSLSTVSENSSVTTSAPVIGFRPMIANLDDLLPDSPSTDPIELAPELAPSGPLQELNDISTFLGSNLSGLMDIDVEDPANSVCIHNTDNQQTSIQEALDFVASETEGYDVDQTISKSFSSNSANGDTLIIAPMIMNRIQNIGYTCSTESESTSTQSNSRAFKFYCFSDRCTFLYSSEAIGLENHFLLEHPQSKWNGYCNTCASQIKVNKIPNELKFSDEFYHLVSVHTKQGNTESPAPIDATNTAQNESNSSSNDQQPRLKLRRLSGDCLSTAMMQSDSLSNIILESYDDSNSFSDLIRFNPCVTTPDQSNKLADTVTPTSIECLPDDVPFFTNISKDFEITSISSGIEPTELSAIVKSALSAETSSKSSDGRNSGALQICNVVSLGETLLEDVSSQNLPETITQTSATSTEVSNNLSLPKITNVCSLSSNSATRQIGSLWTQQITQERNELVKSASESMKTSRLLVDTQSLSIDLSPPPARRYNNDSPGPMIVSETLPAGQATAGDFVITQTVSAQYSEGSTIGSSKKPKLGFNISISSAPIVNAKLFTSSPTPTTAASTENVETVSTMSSILKPTLYCMEPSCKFTTRHFVAIIDHVKWHEKKNDAQQQEYLRCSLCQQKLHTVDAFTQHLRIEHYTGSVNSATPAAESQLSETNPTSVAPAEPCALTEKIRNILNQNQIEITAKEGVVSTCNKSSQILDGSMKNSHKSRLLQTIKEMVAKTGISENKLFRCSVKDCNVKLNEISYHTHVLYHLSTVGNMNNIFPCPHCKAKCQNISALKTHIKSHGRHRIFCYLCMETAVNDAQMSRHFAQKHWQNKDLNSSILEHGEFLDGVPIPYYVTNICPLTENNIREFGNKLIIEWQRKKAATRTHFNPDEIELLPIQAIFSKEIYCALCLYKTKVRTNMVRHMMQHKNTPPSVEGSTGGPTNFSTNTQKDGNSNVCSTDPINPVPCLISNEKHFDRMTNLASSSLGPIVPQGANASNGSNNSNISSLVSCKLRYTYIPQSKRFKCAVPGCDYITICEDVFRSHLSDSHSEARPYKCLFCHEELCKRTLVPEKIIQHLRFHDRTIYQCEQCNHHHYIRHIVDRHALEKHGHLSRANILVFVRDIEGSLEGNRKVLLTYGKKTKDSNTSGNILEVPKKVPNENNAASIATNVINSAKSVQKFPKFICDLCEHKTITYNQLIAHSNSQHGFKQPYQCPYCLHFTAWAAPNVKTHITEEHPGEALKVNRLFGKMTAAQQLKSKKEFLQQKNQLNLNEPPPKPLWQRDDPKRARQIRGIPMEDEEESEKLRKRLRLNEDYYDDEGGEEVVESDSGNGLGHPNLYLNRFEFGCYHCEYKSNNIDDLKSSHWNNVHSNMDGLSSKPFLFRLLNRLKCAECQNFIGCFWELQNHMTVDHSKPISHHALDPRAKKLVCGYCEYDCTNVAQLLRHHLRDDHQPQDLKGLTSIEMAKVMRLECSSAVSFVHCTLCSELFNSRLAVVKHAGEKHGDESEHFSFRELNNKTIYRCSECTYSSTDELTTLRHMINHYRKFTRCYFCNQPQVSFNDYMQHCYSDHRAEIKRFSEIYTFNDIRKYLMQILIIFPNGWIINKKNLRYTPYGNEERLKILYAEICKTSQEPPIPRLSLGRLVARKSIEAKQQQNHLEQPELSVTNSTSAVMQLAGNAVPSSKKQLPAQKISKRRSTIAVGNDDVSSFQTSSKKQKLSTHIVTNSTVSVPPPPKFKSDEEDKTASSKHIENPELALKPFSYYGKCPETEDWSKLHTKISIAGVNTPITLDKFKILVQIDTYVSVEKLDITKYKLPRSISSKEEDSVTTTENDSIVLKNISQYEHVKKACPASQKYRFT